VVIGIVDNIGRVPWLSAIAVVCITAVKVSVLCVISTFVRSLM